jgi:hypothetical protein
VLKDEPPLPAFGISVHPVKEEISVHPIKEIAVCKPSPFLDKLDSNAL